MKQTLLALTAAAALLTACQKEADLEDPAAPTANNSQSTGQLVRDVLVEGSDSTVSTYAYDTAGRFLAYQSSDASYTSSTRVVRNAAGIITQIITKGTDVTQLGLDSIIAYVAYNAAASRYTSKQSGVTIGGVFYGDSIAYNYDASGNLSAAVEYTHLPVVGFHPSSRRDFTYAGGNLTVEKDYAYNNGAWELSITATHTFDTKAVPLKLGAEAILLDAIAAYGTNNITSVQSVHANDPGNNYSQTFTYTYNGANKPVTSAILQTPGPFNTTQRFYYN